MLLLDKSLLRLYHQNKIYKKVFVTTLHTQNIVSYFENTIAKNCYTVCTCFCECDSACHLANKQHICWHYQGLPKTANLPCFGFPLHWENIVGCFNIITVRSELRKSKKILHHFHWKIKHMCVIHKCALYSNKYSTGTLKTNFWCRRFPFFKTR